MATLAIAEHDGVTATQQWPRREAPLSSLITTAKEQRIVAGTLPDGVALLAVKESKGDPNRNETTK
jgi:hypothetical protein